MSRLNGENLREALNTDPEFQLSARYWNGLVKLDFGDRVYIISVHDGSVENIQEDPTMYDPSDLSISASSEGWDELLAEMPRPFYQDIYSASVHHDFEIEGDLEQFFAYHAALRRMTQIMRGMVAA